ncbi:MAG TPA: DUF6338 family protein [Anaerolineae bacterium]|nr:DUF6338 family protein [Anaerolineae bacterium]
MPENAEALALVLLFTVPAYLALRLYQSRYPVSYYESSRSVLGEVSLYVFLGVIVNIGALLFISLISFLAAGLGVPQIAVNSNLWIQLIILGLFSGAYLVTSWGIAYLVSGLMTYILRPPEIPLWWDELGRLIAKQTLDRTIYWILVRLQNGDRCVGAIGRVRWVGDEQNTIEIALENSFYWPQSGPSPLWAGRILLKSKDVAWLGLYAS